EGEYIDGANQAALLIMWTTCGSFELRNTSFFDTADGLTELLENQFLPPEVVTAIVAALEAVAPEVSGFELVFPDTEPYAVFAGVTDTLADLNHALSEV